MQIGLKSEWPERGLTDLRDDLGAEQSDGLQGLLSVIQRTAEQDVGDPQALHLLQVVYAPFWPTDYERLPDFPLVKASVPSFEELSCLMSRSLGGPGQMDVTPQDDLVLTALPTLTNIVDIAWYVPMIM